MVIDHVTPSAIDILLVEDSRTDADFTIRALQNGRLRNRVLHANDGVEALACLRREGSDCGMRTPDLILLDLNMPRMDGRELLREIRGDEALRKIPVVVLITSEEDRDVFESGGLKANAYIVKPVDLGKLFEAMHRIDRLGSDGAKLPETDGVPGGGPRR